MHISRGGEKINHDLVADSLSKMCVNNYQNRLMDVRLIACQVRVVFRHSVVLLAYFTFYDTADE